MSSGKFCNDFAALISKIFDWFYEEVPSDKVELYVGR